MFYWQVTENKHLKTIVSMAGPDLMCIGSSDSSKNVLKVIDCNVSTDILHYLYRKTLNVYRD